MSQPPPPPPKSIHHELRTAANSAPHLLPHLPSLLHRTANPTLLDVGCGPGTISTTLARALPTGHVTATDVNPSVLPRARALAAEAAVPNISFAEADVFALPFPDETFDVTHCHQVLCHTSAPWDALREMLRVTKPGGMVAAREGDLGSECVWPEIPALLSFHDLVVKSITAGGGSAAGGRQLLAWALRAGARRDEITAGFGCWCYGSMEENRVWAQAMAEQVRGGRLRDAGLKMGLATEEGLEEMAKAWEEWMEKEDAILGMMQGEIIIRKKE